MVFTDLLALVIFYCIAIAALLSTIPECRRDNIPYKKRVIHVSCLAVILVARLGAEGTTNSGLRLAIGTAVIMLIALLALSVVPSIRLTLKAEEGYVVAMECWASYLPILLATVVGSVAMMADSSTMRHFAIAAWIDALVRMATAVWRLIYSSSPV